MRTVKLSEVQQRILDLLSDGEYHCVEEVHACLWDELGSIRNIAFHLSRIRKSLPPGQHIVRESVYRLSNELFASGKSA